MRRSNTFYNNSFNYLYSTGVVFSLYKDFYFFPIVIDIFNTNIWLKEKSVILENKRLLKFKNKFSKKN